LFSRGGFYPRSWKGRRGGGPLLVETRSRGREKRQKLIGLAIIGGGKKETQEGCGEALRDRKIMRHYKRGKNTWGGNSPFHELGPGEKRTQAEGKRFSLLRVARKGCDTDPSEEKRKKKKKGGGWGLTFDQDSD